MERPVLCIAEASGRRSFHRGVNGQIQPTFSKLVCQTDISGDKSLLKALARTVIRGVCLTPSAERRLAACRLVWAGFATSPKAWGCFVETQFSANQSPPRRSLTLLIMTAGLIELIRGGCDHYNQFSAGPTLNFQNLRQIKLCAAQTKIFDAICRLRVS